MFKNQFSLVIIAAFLLVLHCDVFAFPEFVDCSGYPERRIFLESQAMWMRTPGQSGTDFGAVHLGTCFPNEQIVRGRLRFDLIVKIHNNPGILRGVGIQITSRQANTRVANMALSQTCPGHECEFRYTLYADTTLVADGRQEFRFNARITEPDGKTLLATTGWQAYIDNNAPAQVIGDLTGAYRSPRYFTEARGWYTDFGYQNARLESPLPNSVNGSLVIRVSLKRGSGGSASSRVYVQIDPQHDPCDAPSGVVFHRTGEFTGNVTIDTRRLSNGRHHLALRTEVDTPVGSTLGGILILPFTVSN